MIEVSQAKITLFSRLHFLVRDDKYVIVLVLARFGEYQDLFGFAIGIGTSQRCNIS